MRQSVLKSAFEGRLSELMNDDPIKNIPSLRKTKKDAENLSSLKKAWPILRPLFKALGAEVDQIDETLEKVNF